MSTSEKKILPHITMLFESSKKGVALRRYRLQSEKTTAITDDLSNDSLLLFLNIAGHGSLCQHSKKDPSHHYHLPLSPERVVSLIKKKSPLLIQRKANEKHLFFILEISRTWLAAVLKKNPHSTKKEITSFLKACKSPTKPLLTPFCFNLRTLGEELSLPENAKDRPSLWFYAKILELLSHVLLEPSEDFCCHRKERVALERVASVKKSLARDLEHPPSLAECAREAGCSAAYLSRTFSEYTGMTMSRYLRNLRLEHAARLLRSGKHNVTEAAIEVGYASLSHFSKAFSEMFDVCPCDFGLQKKNGAGKDRKERKNEKS